MSQTAHLVGKKALYSFGVNPLKSFFGINTFITIGEAVVEQAVKVSIPIFAWLLLSSIYTNIGKSSSYNKQPKMTEASILGLATKKYKSTFN
jgi:hypothetical protein